MRGTVLYRASSYYCDQPSSLSQAPSACGVQCSTKHLVLISTTFLAHSTKLHFDLEMVVTLQRNINHLPIAGDLEKTAVLSGTD